MQNEQFKKSLGVTDWAKVRNRRYLAEAVSAGVAATIGATGHAVYMNSEAVHKKVAQMISVEKDTVEKSALIVSVSPLVVKPTISRLIRQKGSARGLEAAFNKAIKEGFNEQ